MKAMRTRKFLVFMLVFYITFLTSTLHLVLVSSQNVSFDFHSFNLRNLTLVGDSHLRNGVVGITKELGVPSSSSGAVFYNHPVRFFDLESNITSSFSTRFSFSIPNVNPSSSGDGFTFFLSQNNQTLGLPRSYLGLFNSTQLIKHDFLAVEFDTHLDFNYNDPDDNHVGLDVQSLSSVKTANPISQGIDLKSGNWTTAWIDYKNDEKNLKVFLSNSSFKPQNPLLSVVIDLSDHLKEFMYVGFSGSTEGSTELHLIQNWSFHVSGFVPVRPRLCPHNVSDSSVIEPSPKIPVSNSTNSTGFHKKLGLGLAIAGPGFFCVALAVFGYISVRKWRNFQTQKCFKAEVFSGPREFTYRELKSATKGFHSSRIIGHGAFGTVYKAFFISSGTISAVKRSKHSHEGKTEFLAELSIIACLRHKNLVQLQGWCVEKDELLLVYDFMPNGSLDNLLHHELGEESLLKWTHRYNISIGLASVLTYLHEECEQQVIHRDIKAGNILLDGNYSARLGDFGLAKIMDHDKSPDSTLTAGTMGYLAPEYLQYGKATENTDIFSYGVVVLETACGKRPIEREEASQKMVNLVDWVWGLHSQGRIIEAGDKRLKGEFVEEEMKKLLLVGLSCANPDSSERPSMRRVLQILNDDVEPLTVPKLKPSLTFSSGVVLTLNDIVSDDDGDWEMPRPMFDIKIE